MSTTIGIDVNKRLILRDYREGIKPEERETVILEHLFLVKVIAKQIKRKTKNVLLEDLISAGTIGLIQAVDKFEAGESVFKTYAEYRISGAIRDEVRKHDFLTRTGRGYKKDIEDIKHYIERSTGEKATSIELSRRLNVTESKFIEIFNSTSLHSFTKVQDYEFSSKVDPYYLTERKMIYELLMENIELLSVKMIQVITMMYFKRYSQKKVSDITNIPSARVSQIHKKAMQILRKKLEKYFKYNDDILISPKCYNEYNLYLP